MFGSIMETPLGALYLADDGAAVTQVRFVRDADPAAHVAPSALLRRTMEELARYFAGTLTAFTVPVRLDGTPFQRRVWQALLTIPYGQTRSYGEIARQIGSPNASRAVGMANHRNPVSILVPCHRVIGADGKLVGYGGGLDKKEWLLQLERSVGAHG